MSVDSLRRISFPDDFFQDEVRDGFFIEHKMKCAWAAQMEVLMEIDRICRKHGIQYFADSGTLLGAVRHKGFIPWDDDVDIMMPRPDYDKLIDYLYKNKLPNLTLFDRRMYKDYPYMISRVSDDRYILEFDNEKSIGMGVFIDVYPIDGMGATLKEALKYGKPNDYLSSFCFQATRDHYALEMTKSPIRKLIKRPVFWFCKLVGKDFFQNRIEKRLGKYDYETSEWVGDLIWLCGGEKEIFKREWLDNYIMVPFEQYEFRAPKEYDYVLKQLFGDYMQLPLEEDRIGHHYYRAYRKDDIQ